MAEQIKNEKKAFNWKPVLIVAGIALAGFLFMKYSKKSALPTT